MTPGRYLCPTSTTYNRINWVRCPLKQLIWPVAAILLAVLTAINPFYAPHLTLEIGVAAWLADMVLVLVLSLHPVTARLGALLAGPFLAVPRFLQAPPLPRFLLLCCMALPFAIAVLPMFGPPTMGFRARLAFFFTWLGTKELTRRARSFDPKSLAHLILATIGLAGAMASAKALPAAGPWLLMRWFAGGIMMLALAEMVTAAHNFLTALVGIRAPALMLSPCLSASVAEFWAVRWNPAASALLFRQFFFAPLAHHGPIQGLFAAFFASALAHALLLKVATGTWAIAFVCGAFFLAQPPLILAERWLKVRQWPRAMGRAWTLSALAITSPLIVEPVLKLLEPHWGPPGTFLRPTIEVLGLVTTISVFLSLASLAFCPEPQNAPSPQGATGPQAMDFPRSDLPAPDGLRIGCSHRRQSAHTSPRQNSAD